MDVDLRLGLPDVGDQGASPSCLAFAVSAAHAYMRARGGPYVALSESMVFALAHAMQPQLVGLTVPATRDVLETRGHCRLELWPYDQNQVDVASLPPGAIANDALARLATLEPMGHASGDIEAALRSGQPAVVIIPVFPQLFAPVNGFVATPRPAEVLSETHAMLVVALLDHASHGSVFALRNSWSKSWGDDGYGYVKPQFVDQYVTRAYGIRPMN